MIPLTKKDNPALLLVDVQKGFQDIAYWGGERNNLDAEDHIEKLLLFWRENKLPIFHVKHCSTNPVSPLTKGNEGNDFEDFIIPETNEPIIEKNVNSAFIDTDLKERLTQQQIDTVIIVGLTTDHCISTTTRMSGNFGFRTYLVEDAVATFNKTGANGQEYSAQLIHDTAIASLKDEFATIISTNDVIKTLSL